MPLTAIEKENIAEGFRAAGDRLTSFEQKLKETREMFGKFFNESNSRQRQLLSRFGASLREEAPTNRFWPNDDMAREFGELMLMAAKRKAAGEGVTYEGGYLVPTQLADWIVDRMGSWGKFRRNTLVVPLESDKMLVPRVQTDMTIYCPGEGKSIDESDMTFDQIALVMKKLAALAKVSSELEEDSVIAIGEILGLSFTRSMLRVEDLIAFVGDGTSTYFGMTGIVHALRAVDETIGNIAGLEVASGNAYAEIVLGDFTDTIARLPDDADDGAKWYVNRRFYYSVMHPLAVAAGVGTFLDIISPNRQRFFFGYPVEFTAAMPYVEGNSQICAILSDLRLGSYLGERKKMTIDRSDQVYFANDQIGFRAIERIDINAYGVGDTSEAGPIVGLITAAS
ncbi:MAG: phage major capsid protein [Sedimentisphaerales bacterium]|nr:phage major capsid protein [Sedimentisphaerales bacterium]